MVSHLATSSLAPVTSAFSLPGLIARRPLTAYFALDPVMHF